MILDKKIECLDPFLPHIHIFIVPNGAELCDMDSVKSSSVFDKMITVDQTALSVIRQRVLLTLLMAFACPCALFQTPTMMVPVILITHLNTIS